MGLQEFGRIEIDGSETFLKSFIYTQTDEEYYYFLTVLLGRSRQKDLIVLVSGVMARTTVAFVRSTLECGALHRPRMNGQPLGAHASTPLPLAFD